MEIAGTGPRRTFLVHVRADGPITVEDVTTRERAAVTGLDGVAERIGAWMRTPPPAPERIGALREQVEALRGGDTSLELCDALIDLGSELHRCELAVEAREVLAEACAIAQAQRSASRERRAGAALVEAGARPRRAALRGPESLTPSERNVAELVARGCSNREVAAALVLSEKTVEGHLRGVFRKLGIQSRIQIAAQLDQTVRPAAGATASVNHVGPALSGREGRR